MGRFINIYAKSPMQTLTGKHGGNLGYVTNPVSQNQNLGSDVDKENPENQMKAMDARNEQNAKKIMSLNEQKSNEHIPAYATGTDYVPEEQKALVGESGVEVITTPNGQQQLVDKPTIVTLPQGSSVTPIGDNYEGRNPEYDSNENSVNQAQNNPSYTPTPIQSPDYTPMNLGEKDIKTIDGQSIGTQQNPTTVKPDVSAPMTAKDLVESMKEQRAQIDEDYQKQLNRARMFEALHRGLSALTQFGAKTNGNAALPYDDTIWKSVQTELGQRWKQNRSDLTAQQNYDLSERKLQTEMLKAQNLNDYRTRSLEIKEEEMKSKIDTQKKNLDLLDARINHYNSLTDVQKSKLSLNDLESELKEAKIYAENMKALASQAQTTKYASDAKNNSERADAYVRNIESLIKSREKGKTVTQTKEKTGIGGRVVGKETTTTTTTGDDVFSFGNDKEAFSF